MKLNIRSFALTCGILWGLAMFMVSLFNLFLPGYGLAFLVAISSVYPGYTAASGFGSVLIGTGYGLVDGTIGGAVFAWLYNTLSKN